ncbi:MAG: hypothetical protein KA149_13300 [Chitinophagales bacterium]|nr:hypothetical protein [Chitinophagales bacterium]
MKLSFTFLLLFVAYGAFCQVELLDELTKDAKPKREYVAFSFKTTRVISGHSVETVKKNQLDFRISHRFGDMAASNNDHIHSLFGFDQAADIGIIFEYGITDDLTVGIGRMKGAGPLRELWNANLKYKVLKQTKDFKYPMTITLFGNTSISSMRSSTDPTSLAYFEKGYKGFAHRLSYTMQALMAVKATDWLTLQLSPTFVWRNKVAYNDKNGMFFLGLSARAKFSKRYGIIFEYFLPIIKPGVGGREYFPMVRGIKNSPYYPNLHIGFEFETGGHVFHVNFTNSRGMLENDFLPYNTANWAQGAFRLGFTISRSFPLSYKGKPKEDRKYWKKGSVEDEK